MNVLDSVTLIRDSQVRGGLGSMYWCLMKSDWLLVGSNWNITHLRLVVRAVLRHLNITRSWLVVKWLGHVMRLFDESWLSNIAGFTWHVSRFFDYHISWLCVYSWVHEARIPRWSCQHVSIILSGVRIFCRHLSCNDSCNYK